MPTKQRIQSRPELVRNTLILLEHEEVEFAHSIGELRHNNNRKAGTYDSASENVKMSSLDADKQGAEAELAFMKIANIYPEYFFDTNTKSKKKGTDLGDCVLDGYVVDIKSTKYKTGKLIQSGGNKQSNIDIYCLIIIEEEGRYNLKGFYPSSLLLQEENYGKHFPGRPCFAVDHKVLMDYDDCVKNMLTKAA